MTVRCLAVLAMLSGCDGVFGLQRLHAPEDVDGAMPADVLPSNFEVVKETHAHANGGGTSLGYTLTVPSGANQIVLFYIALGSNCPPGSLSLANATLSYGATQPMRLARLVGTPCAADATSSEVWMLVDPPAGAASVGVILDTYVQSIHASALVIRGVDLQSPSGGCTSTSQRGAAAVVAVPSAPGEMVVSFIGQGTGIQDAGSDAQLIYLDNVNDFTTLNNSAVSTLDGISPSALATWNFTGTDEWQVIACSLRPAL